MLELNFVRDNLPLVEEKLRQRGMNPDELLSGFRDLDSRRRQAITESENLKARRNRASEEVAKLKKAGGDATALIEETKKLRKAAKVAKKSAAAASPKTKRKAKKT